MKIFGITMILIFGTLWSKEFITLIYIIFNFDSFYLIHNLITLIYNIFNIDSFYLIYWYYYYLQSFRSIFLGVYFRSLLQSFNITVSFLTILSPLNWFHWINFRRSFLISLSHFGSCRPLGRLLSRGFHFTSLFV